jgi:hypothetical protein
VRDEVDEEQLGLLGGGEPAAERRTEESDVAAVVLHAVVGGGRSGSAARQGPRNRRKACAIDGRITSIPSASLARLLAFVSSSHASWQMVAVADQRSAAAPRQHLQMRHGQQPLEAHWPVGFHVVRQSK